MALAMATIIVTLIGAGASSAAAAPRTLSFLELDNAFAGTGGFNPQGNAPPSPGQGVTFSGTLYKWAGSKRGAPAGQIQVVCTVAAGHPFHALCSGTMFLQGGIIELLGASTFAYNASNVAIVGGTGAFAGVTGYMHAKDIRGPNAGAAADTLHLT